MPTLCSEGKPVRSTRASLHTVGGKFLGVNLKADNTDNDREPTRSSELDLRYELPLDGKPVKQSSARSIERLG